MVLTRGERLAALWKFPLIWAGVFALVGLTYAVSILIGTIPAILAVWGGATAAGWLVERYFWPD